MIINMPLLYEELPSKEGICNVSWSLLKSKVTQGHRKIAKQS